MGSQRAFTATAEIALVLADLVLQRGGNWITSLADRLTTPGSRTGPGCCRWRRGVPE